MLESFNLGTFVVYLQNFNWNVRLKQSHTTGKVWDICLILHSHSFDYKDFESQMYIYS